MFDDLGEARRVVATVEAVEAQVPELGGPAVRPARVSVLEIGGQAFGDPRTFDAQHQVRPLEIVVAEVDPADVGDIVGDDELLMVAEREPVKQRAPRVGHPHPDAVARQTAEHVAGSLDLLAEHRVGQVARRIDKAVADHEAREVVDQDAAIHRPAVRDGAADLGARRVGLKGHGLDVEPPPGRHHVLAGAAPELVRADQQLIGPCPLAQLNGRQASRGRFRARDGIPMGHGCIVSNCSGPAGAGPMRRG